jgi:outer membrane protein TolC
MLLQRKFKITIGKREGGIVLKKICFIAVSGLLALVVLAGCSGIKPQPLTPEDMSAKVNASLNDMYKGQEAVAGPISLYEAMARAIKYNLDHRLKLMEQALGRHRLSSAKLSLLPKLVSDARADGRSNRSGASSRSLLSGNESLEPSTSQDRTVYTYGLEMSWNILDFGMSYVRAQQESDRGLILEERRRKVIHNIIQDVRLAYWKAVSAQRLLKRIDPLTKRVEQALEKARQVESKRLQAPRASLLYRRDLLQVLREMESLRRDLMTAKTSLAALMNLPLDTKFSLADQSGAKGQPMFQYDLSSVEQYALFNRPEMREEVYQDRISRREVTRQLLQTLPGLEFTGGWNYDSNSFNYNDDWFSWSTALTGNLFDIFTMNTRMATAEATTDVVCARRMALSMAILSQVRISWLRFSQAKREYGLANELHGVVSALLEQSHAEVATGAKGELSAVKSMADAVVAELIRDTAYSELKASMGRFLVSAGVDPLPGTIQSHDLDAIAEALRRRDDSWKRGTIDLTIPVSSEKAGSSAVNPEKAQIVERRGV